MANQAVKRQLGIGVLALYVALIAFGVIEVILH